MSLIAKSCLSGCLALSVALVSMSWNEVAHAQQRQTFTFTQPDRPAPDRQSDDTGGSNDSSARDPESESSSDTTAAGGLRDVVWFLTADGDWNVQMQGRGQARMRGDRGTLVRVNMEHDEGGPPIQLAVFTDGSDIDHVFFSQTGDRPVAAAGIYSRGTNYLMPEGRETRSLRGNGNPGSLANHDGFVRVDQRDGGLLINFSVTAVFCARIRQAPFSSEPPCGGRNYLGSRPREIGQVRGCIVTMDQFRANPDACQQPFQVDRVTPVDDRENVNFKDPGLEVVFSDRVKRSTLEDSFALYTYSSDGAQLKVSGDWRQDGPTQFRFVPEEPLYSGTTYIARVEGGSEGVQSQEGAWLDDPYQWRFSSALDLDAQAPDDEPPVRLHNYQVIRDGELTLGKPTLTRAYITWEPHDEVAKDMQPDSFELEMKPSVRYERWVGQRDALPVSDAVRVWRHDEPGQFNDEDRRHALQTVNFFGWKPQNSGSLQLTVSAHDPFPKSAEPVEHVVEQDYRVWRHDPGELNIYYTFAEIAHWADGVPTDVQSHLLRTLFKAEDYVPQYLPYRGAKAQFIGSPPSFIDFLVSMFRDPATLAAWVAFGKFENLTGDTGSSLKKLGSIAADIGKFPPLMLAQRINDALYQGQYGTSGSNAAQILAGAYMRYLQEILSDRVGGDDMMVMFIPPGFLPADSLGRGISHADSALYHGHLLDYRVRSVVMRIDRNFPADGLAVGLVHEFGHVFGLPHNPGDIAGVDIAVPYSSEPIEGFKLSKDGRDGWNKSSTEGNEQSDDLASLMWPAVLESSASLITESEYQRVQSAIETPFQRGSFLQKGWPFGDTNNSHWAMSHPIRNIRNMVALAQAGTSRSAHQTLTDAQPIQIDSLQSEPDHADSESVLLTGTIIKDADVVMVYPPVRGAYQFGDSALQADSDTHQYWVQLRDAQGQILLDRSIQVQAAASSTLDHSDQEWMMPALPASWLHFRVLLPIDLMQSGQARLVVIGRGSQDLASYPVGAESVSAPKVSVDDGRLVWASDTVAENVYYQLDYRLAGPQAEGPWQVVSLRQKEPQVQISELAQWIGLPDDSPFASGAQLRVSSTDGLQYADTIVALEELNLESSQLMQGK